MASASAWSCVTYTAVKPNCRCKLRISVRTWSLSLASRLESGLSKEPVRLDSERTGQRDPLLLSARERVRKLSGMRLKLHL